MSYRLETAAREFVEYIGTNVGPTDDYLCEISFDDDEEAERFMRLYRAVLLALEDLE